MEKKLCKRCLSEMEKTLKVCPTCGAKVKMSIWKKVGIGFGIFILLGIMGSFSEDSSTATQNNSNATVNETKEKVQNEIEVTWSSFFVTLLRLFYAVYLFSNGVSPFNEECGLLEL